MKKKPTRSRGSGDASDQSHRMRDIARRARAEPGAKHQIVEHREKILDEGLAATFPASDPVSISPRPR